MSMQRKRFAVGIAVGLVFALAIVASANYAAFSRSPASAANGSLTPRTTVVVSTITSTVSMASTETSATYSIASSATSNSVPAYVGNQTMTSTTTEASSTSPPSSVTTIVVTTTESSSRALPPSNLDAIFGPAVANSVTTSGASGAASAPQPSVPRGLGEPLEAVVILVPVLVAILLGLLVYRTSRAREKTSSS